MKRARRRIDVRRGLRATRDAVASVRWVATTFWSQSRLLLSVDLAIQVVGAILLGATPIALKWVVDHGAGDRTVTIATAVALASVTVLPTALGLASRIMTAWSTRQFNRVADHAVIRVGRGVTHISPFEDPAQRARIETAPLDAFHATRLWELSAAAARQVLAIVVMASSAVIVSPWLMPLVLLLAIPQVIVAMMLAKARTDERLRTTPENRRLEYYLRSATRAASAREIRVFGLEAWLEDRHDSLASKVLRVTLAAKTRAVASSFGFAAVGAILCFALITFPVANAAVSAGAAVMLAQTALTLTRLSTEGAGTWGEMYEAILAANRFRQLPTTPDLVDRDAGTLRLDKAHALTCSTVSYSYADGTRGLETVDLVVPKGKLVALVGPNGSGKSTLVRLIARLDECSGGEIRFDNAADVDGNVYVYRRQVGTVFQDFARFAMSIRDNVAFGADVDGLDDEAKEARVWQALRAVGADDLATRNPDGLSTNLGSEEGGIEVSGGEWQKVASARALYLDAPVVILDEPTSALDVDSEGRLAEEIRRIAAGRIAVLVTHRLSMAASADIIAVMDQGRLVETGSHDELLQSGGMYSKMYLEQAKHYRCDDALPEHVRT